MPGNGIVMLDCEDCWVDGLLRKFFAKPYISRLSQSPLTPPGIGVTAGIGQHGRSNTQCTPLLVRSKMCDSSIAPSRYKPVGESRKPQVVHGQKKLESGPTKNISAAKAKKPTPICSPECQHFNKRRQRYFNEPCPELEPFEGSR